MELVQKYMDVQTKFITYKEATTSNGEEFQGKTFRKTFTTFNGSDITLTINGQEIGTLQAISYDRSEDDSVVEETFVARPYEATFSLIDTEVNQNLLQDMLQQEMAASYEISAVQPNRAERRANKRRTHDEEYQDQYRRGLHQMLGGRKHWN